MLAPGGEFAFVAFGEAVNQVISAIFFVSRPSVLCFSLGSLSVS
jgi:hypothetical protein